MPQYILQPAGGSGGRHSDRTDRCLPPQREFPHQETDARINAFVLTDEWQVPTQQVLRLGDADKSSRRFAAGSSMKSVLAELQHLTELENDWDGYGAPSVQSSTVVHVMQFLCGVVSPGIPTPVVVVTGRGRIQLEWHLRDVELDVEIDRDGTYEATYLGSGSEAEWNGRISLGVEPELARRIAELAVQEAIVS